MRVNREELERMAVAAVDAEHYYDLMDTLGETPDEDLLRIISAQVNDSPSDK